MLVIRAALALLLLGLASCRARGPIYEYEPPVTTVTGGIEPAPPVDASTTTSITLPPRPSVWQRPQRW